MIGPEQQDGGLQVGQSQGLAADRAGKHVSGMGHHGEHGLFLTPRFGKPEKPIHHPIQFFWIGVIETPRNHRLSLHISSPNTINIPP